MPNRPQDLSLARRFLAFEREVQARLRPLTPRLTTVLGRLIRHPYPAGFETLDFEIHGQGAFEQGFPVFVYYYRRGYDQVYPEGPQAAAYPFDIPQCLLKIRRVYPPSLVKRFTVTDRDYWHEDVAAGALIPWFRRCWLRAGGRRFPHRSMIAPHDTVCRLDLKSGRWVKSL